MTTDFDREAELIKKAASGDEAAFEALVRDYRDLVYSVAYQNLRNSDDAFDVSQEVFIRIYRGIGSFRGDCKFATWVYKVTMNAVRDFVRKASIRETSPLTFEGEDGRETDIPELVCPDSDEPESAALRSETVRAVRRAIDSLSFEHRQIVILRDIEGRSYDEISEMLGLELGTVKSRLNRARLAIKKYLQGDGEWNIF